MFKPYCKKRRLLAFTLLITITITKINVFSYPAEYSDQQTPLLGSFSSKILQKKEFYANILLNSSTETVLLFKVTCAFNAVASLASTIRFTKPFTVSCFFIIS